VDGRGRPSSHQPRPINATRDRLETTIRPHTERIGRREAEAGCCIWRPHVPTAGDLAQSAGALLTVAQEPQGTAQNSGFLNDPVMVKSRFLQQPDRMEAWGVGLWRSLLRGRLMERAMRRHVDAPSTALPGWDKPVTARPTACMMVTKFAGVSVVKGGHDRQLAHPLSAVPHQSLTALDVPAPCFTLPTGSQRTAMAVQRRSRRPTRIRQG
jgi:hypothetical protein